MIATKKFNKAVMISAAAFGLAFTGQVVAEPTYLGVGKDGIPTNAYGECWEVKGGRTSPECAGIMPDGDADGDGVLDSKDRCPGTPKGVAVDAVGCPLDSDGDGVPDYKDKCPGTPRGTPVDDRGCPLDSDGDGVTDALDQCPGTPKGVKVDAVGCEQAIVLGDVNFDLDKATLTTAGKAALDNIASSLESSNFKSATVVGHTDSTGTADYNMDLSEKRAVNAMHYLIDKGVPSSKLKAEGKGESMPMADNSTKEGRAKNRRVEFKVSR
ncbi:MAG: OmpA family protein [Gammaproteobacteria bacterium]|nr:OmpA family protein [Gammaproteobacteria bacterium]